MSFGYFSLGESSEMRFKGESSAKGKVKDGKDMLGVSYN